MPSVLVETSFISNAQEEKLLRSDAYRQEIAEGIADPVRWTLEQLKTRFPAMVKQAGYEEIAERIDQQVVADHLPGLEPEITADLCGMLSGSAYAHAGFRTSLFCCNTQC